MKTKSGNVLILVTVIMLSLLIMIPGLVRYLMDESKSTAKIAKNTRAFHLAETGIERGFQVVLQSTTTAEDVLAGTAIAGYNFDTTYTDATGEYRIRFSSASGSDIVLTAVGRSADGEEVRGVQSRFVPRGLVQESVIAKGTISYGANSAIDWAPVITKASIVNSKNWPRLYSAGGIGGKDVNPAPPNTDNIQYWAYKTDIPDMPSLDLPFYKAQAQGLGAVHANCGGTYYKAVNQTFKGCRNFSGTWYLEGNATFQGGASGGLNGNYLVGQLIVIGGITIQGNGGSHQTLNVPVPPEAWKEYGNAWARYQSHDAGAPASHAAAVAANYIAATNKNISNILVNGLLYAGGNVTWTGAGNSAVYGVAIIQGNPAMGATFDFWFNPTAAANVATTTRGFNRISWRDVSCTWVGAGAPACS